MKLPNGERADLGSKLEDYSLNPFHRHGQHKARVFESALGITLANAELMEAKAADEVTRSRASQVVASVLEAIATAQDLRARLRA